MLAFQRLKKLSSEKTCKVTLICIEIAVVMLVYCWSLTRHWNTGIVRNSTFKLLLRTNRITPLRCGRIVCPSQPGPSPLLKLGHPEQAAQDHVQAASECLPGERPPSLSGQSLPVLRHPHSKGEPPVFRFVPTASCRNSHYCRYAFCLLLVVFILLCQEWRFGPIHREWKLTTIWLPTKWKVCGRWTLKEEKYNYCKYIHKYGSKNSFVEAAYEKVKVVETVNKATSWMNPKFCRMFGLSRNSSRWFCL